jgi:hypothetical protein
VLRIRATSAQRESGQASVEMVALVPLALLLGAVAWQLVLTGHTLWLCANAARVAARADLVGKSPARAARTALPRSLERDLSVPRLAGDGIRVRVHLPVVLHAWHSPVTVAATASLSGGG